MTPPGILQQFDHLDRNSPQFPDQLTNLLYNTEFKGCIPKLQDQDIVWLVEYLGEVLDSLDPSGPAFRKCLSELGRICGTREKLPPWYILEGSLSILSRYPVASGGSGDIYEGSLNDKRVCVKRLRIYASQESQTGKTFHREVVMWRHLTHPNIVPLLGITLEPLQLISTWIPGGELKVYIIGNPDTDRLALLCGITHGLHYLHFRHIVHGDLKGPNILVDDSGCPKIADFGLAMVTQNQDSVRSAQGEHAHTARWTAPEILNDQGSHSKEADVFSFAMVMVEAFTGEVPFHPTPTTATIWAILDKKRPARPNHPHLTNELWVLMGRCWNQDSYLRPEMSEVLETLHGSDASPERPFKRNLATILTSSQTLVGPVGQRVVKQTGSPKSPLSGQDQEPSPGTETSSSTNQGESAGQGGSRSTQISGSSQAAAHPQMKHENSSHSEERGGKLSGPTAQGQSRRGTEESELYSPLPTDPVPVDSKQLPDRTGKSHTDLLDSLRRGDSSRENVGNAGVGPGNDFKADTDGTHHSESQGDNCGTSRHSLQDPGGNPTRSVLGMTDDAVPAKSPSEARPPGVNTGSDTSLHVPQTGTNRPQTNLGEAVPKDPSTNSHSSLPLSHFRGWTVDSVLS